MWFIPPGAPEMKVKGIKIMYPSGQMMIEMGDIEAPVNEIIELMSHGMRDITEQLPKLTGMATEVAREYAKAK